MSGRLVQAFTLEELLSALPHGHPQITWLQLQYNISPLRQIKVITAAPSGTLGDEALWMMQFMQWGTLTQDGQNLQYAVPLTQVLEQMDFWGHPDCIPCVVPASGVLLWAGHKNLHSPLYVHSPDNALMLLPGFCRLLRRSTNSGWAHSAFLFTHHDKSRPPELQTLPAMLAQDDFHHWLKASTPEERAMQIHHLQIRMPSTPLDWHTISPLVHDPNINHPCLIEPVP